jgi:hypothetical protein
LRRAVAADNVRDGVAQARSGAGQRACRVGRVAAMKAYQYGTACPDRRHLAEAFYFAVDYDPERVVAAYRAMLQLDPTNDAALSNRPSNSACRKHGRRPPSSSAPWPAERGPRFSV